MTFCTTPTSTYIQQAKDKNLIKNIWMIESAKIFKDFFLHGEEYRIDFLGDFLNPPWHWQQGLDFEKYELELLSR